MSIHKAIRRNRMFMVIVSVAIIFIPILSYIEYEHGNIKDDIIELITKYNECIAKLNKNPEDKNLALKCEKLKVTSGKLFKSITNEGERLITGVLTDTIRH